MSRKGLAFMSESARTCRESQGPWWIATTNM